MLVKRKDLPTRIQELIDGHESEHKYKLPRTVRVHVVDIADIPPTWHDANYRHIYAVDLERGVLGGVSGSTDSAPFSIISAAASQGGKQQLKNNQAIVVFNTYPKSVEVYLHPSNVKVGLLPPGPPSLTLDEWLVLYITRNLISSARKEEFRKIPNCDSILNSLGEKGYLDKRGALTFEGKKVFETITPELVKETNRKAREYDIWGVNIMMRSNPVERNDYDESELFPPVILEYPYPEHYRNPDEPVEPEEPEEEPEEEEEEPFKIEIDYDFEPQVPKDVVEGIKILSSYFEVPVPILRMKRGVGKRSGYRSTYRGGGCEIIFGTQDLKDRPEGAMLHEFAHHLAFIRHPGYPVGHGLGFCVALKDVIEAWGVDYGKVQTLEYKRVSDFLAGQGISVKAAATAMAPSVHKIHPWIYTGSKVIISSPDIGMWTAVVLSTRGHRRAKVRLGAKLAEPTHPTSVVRFAVPGGILLVSYSRIFEMKDA